MRESIGYIPSCPGVATWGSSHVTGSGDADGEVTQLWLG